MPDIIKHHPDTCIFGLRETIGRKGNRWIPWYLFNCFQSIWHLPTPDICQKCSDSIQTLPYTLRHHPDTPILGLREATGRKSNRLKTAKQIWWYSVIAFFPSALRTAKRAENWQKWQSLIWLEGTPNLTWGYVLMGKTSPNSTYQKILGWPLSCS